MVGEVQVKERGLVSWFNHRDIHTYPRGWFQIGLLVVVVLANVVASYEGELAPIAPILLPYLKLTTIDYGFIVAGTTAVSGIVAIVVGHRLDRYGRSLFVSAGTFVTALMVFLMTLVHTSLEFIIVRLIMAITLGVVAPATSGLVRDFTPRVGRALGFGFWTFGPVGANFAAAGIAGATLPIFHDAWQSQFVIMGILCLILSIIVVLFIRDMSPELRAQVVRNRQEVAVAQEKAKATTKTMASPRLVYRAPRIWALAIGITLFLLLYFFATAFGPIYLTSAFKYPPAVAASVSSYFWLANLGALLVVGYISDRLQLRKIISFLGVLCLLVFMYFWIHLIGHAVPPGRMILYTSLQGIFLGMGYGPWMALFSENIEDIHPTLQGTGWAVLTMVEYVLAGAAGAVTFLVVASSGWAAWLDVCWAGVLVYAVLIFFGRGPWFKRPRSEHG